MTVALRRSWAKDLDAGDAVRTAQAAGRGVRRRAGHPLSGTGRPRPVRRNTPLLARRPRRRSHLDAAADGGTPRRAEGLPHGRVCTKRSARGHGHTNRLLQAALAEVGDYPCRINAQTYLAEMYSHHGFVHDGEGFLDDGIPHVPMVKAGSHTEAGQP